MAEVPAGWHPDPERSETWRYWDGQAWTDQRAPMESAPAPERGIQRVVIANKGPGFFALFFLLGVVYLIGNAIFGGEDEHTSTSKPATSQESTTSHNRPSATEAGNFAHCQKVTGAYLFRVQNVPFTAAYRRGIDGACEAADPDTSVAVTAELAKEIARGESP